jgi:hypothetical protein
MPRHEAIRMEPPIEQPEEKRHTRRTDNELPRLKKSNVLSTAPAPKRAYSRHDIALPNEKKSSNEQDFPTGVIFAPDDPTVNRLAPDPSLVNVRTDNDDPREMKSSADSFERTRRKQRVDNVEPRCIMSSTENGCRVLSPPSRVFPNNDITDPHRSCPRTLNAEPKPRKSQTETCLPMR